MNQKAASLIAIATVIACLGSAVTLCVINPLRRSADEIEREFLASKPLGTSISEVQRWLEQDKQLAIEKNDIRIRAYLGSCYQFPLMLTYVDAYWIFDETGRLRKVEVRKSGNWF